MNLETITLVFWVVLLFRGSRAIEDLEAVSNKDSTRAPLLETLSSAQQSLFNEVIAALDANFRPPFLVGTVPNSLDHDRLLL
jgi:hypothetical protein